MIDVQRTDFVALPIDDMARAEELYGGTLGLLRNPSADEHWAEDETGNLTIALAGWPAIGLHVLDVEEARAKLEDADGVCHIALFKDSDDNALMLHRRFAPYKDGTRP